MVRGVCSAVSLQLSRLSCPASDTVVSALKRNARSVKNEKQ